MNILIKKALEASYRRAVNDATPSASFWSTFAALCGTQTKYLRDPHDETLQTQPLPNQDDNLYNWVEQILFFPLRLAKNILKLGTEFLWSLAYHSAFQCAAALKEKGDRAAALLQPGTRSAKSDLFYGLNYLFQGLGYLSWIIGKLGQRLTSPITSLKETYHYIYAAEQGESPLLAMVLGSTAVSLQGVLTLSAYFSLTLLLSPILIPGLAAASITAVLYALPILIGVRFLLREISPKVVSPVAPPDQFVPRQLNTLERHQSALRTNSSNPSHRNPSQNYNTQNNPPGWIHTLGTTPSPRLQTTTQQIPPKNAAARTPPAKQRENPRGIPLSSRILRTQTQPTLFTEPRSAAPPPATQQLPRKTGRP